MKTAVLCIAAEFERPYLEEWWNWHHSLGFDDINVITNNWTLDIPAPSFVHSFRVDGQVVQLPAYNAWLQKFKEQYDWLLVIDVDEFIWMPDSLQSFLECRQNVLCIGLSWVHFGDGFSTETSGSVVQRFQRCSSKLDKHVKPLVNLKGLSQFDSVFFVNPHFVCVGTGKTGYWLPWVDVFGNANSGPYCRLAYSRLEGIQVDASKPLLLHFYTKTLCEWRKRRGPEHMRADCNQFVTEDFFYKFNKNDIAFPYAAERQRKLV